MKINNNFFNYYIKSFNNITSSNPKTNIGTGNSSRLIDPYYNILFAGNTKKYSNEIEEIEDNLATIGINAYLKDKCNYKNLLVAKSIQDAFVDIINAGFHIPKGIAVHCDEAQENFDHNSRDMAYTDVTSIKREKPEIHLNTPRYRSKKGVPYAFHNIGDKRIYNTKVDIYHEFAHCYQAIKDRANYLRLGEQEFDEANKKEISKCINDYATTNKAEFVAEYFAYKLAGIKVTSDKIDLEKLYNECKGPRSRKF